MGVTTQYLRFVSGSVFGAVSNNDGNVAYIPIQKIRGRHIAVTTCEDVVLWDLKTKQKLVTCKGDKSEAVRLCVLDSGLLAVGYVDGAIKIFSFEDGSLKVTLHGHKASVMCMATDPTGSKLVTGAKDGVIIVWDIVNESGLYKFRGHKGPITKIEFLSEIALVSSSKDGLVKFWDMDTQHCFHTLVGHRSEVWNFLIINGKWLICGTSAAELFVWKLIFVSANGSEVNSYEDLKRARESTAALDEPGNIGALNNVDEISKLESNLEFATPLRCVRVGSILRQGKGRTCGLQLDPADSSLIYCWGTDNQLELFQVLGETEARRKQHKRLKKELKRKPEINDNLSDFAVTDLFRRLCVVICQGKVSSVDIANYRTTDSKRVRFLVGLKNNTVDVMEVLLPGEAAKVSGQMIDTLRPFGHRSDVRALAFTSDNVGILSASGEHLKLWNIKSLQCIRSLDCEYALFCDVLCGDRHAVVGTKSGKIQLFDLAAGELITNIDAHQGACWSMSFTSADRKMFVTGGGDKLVKFWEVEYTKKTRKLSLVSTRCLDLPEEVLCVKVSPNGKLLAVSLADSTIKVFFVDTLKFFLSLYGHQYPVLCIDISDDSSLLISGSSDRNIKIWGLDFGDCHRSLFAHSDSVMALRFLPKSHQFFSVGKDHLLKHWDADTFQRVLTLEGHQAEVWALAISANGRHIVTASHDKSLRVWDKTEEPLVLEEQRELEREEEAEREMLDGQDIDVAAAIPREAEKDGLDLAGRRTLVTVKCAERLLEALDVYEKETEKFNEARKVGSSVRPTPHPLMLVHRTTCRFRYLAEEVKRITAAELEETLLVLPFDSCLTLFSGLIDIIERGWDVELACRAVCFLIRVHSGQLLATESAISLVSRAQKVIRAQMSTLVDTVAFNLEALSFVQREAENHQDEHGSLFFANATENRNRKRRQARRLRTSAVVVSVG